jgi:PAS domain S-box-containing protein
MDSRRSTPAAAAGSDRAPEMTSEPVRVLHVDDEPGLASLAARYMERENGSFDVTPMTAPEQVLEQLADGSVDCVVTDYDMPGLNGLDLLERVRETHPDLPVVLFTGKGSEAVAAEAFAAGATDYLRKERTAAQYTVLANRVEQAVERARVERRYQTLLGDVSDVVFRTDADGRLTYLNPAWEDLTGLSVSATLGEHLQTVLSPAGDDGKVVDSDGGGLFPPDGEDRRLGRVRCTDADGESRWLELTVRAIRDGERLTGSAGTLRDVTEQVRAERERAEQAAEREQIFERIADGFYAVDDEWRFTFVNERFADWAGTTPDDLTGSVLWERFPAARGTDFERQYREAMASQEPASFEAYYEPQDRWVAVRVYPSPEGLSVYSRDITDQRRRDAALREERAFAESVFDGLPDVLYAFTADGELLRWNDRLGEVTGYTDEEITDMHPLEFVPEADTDAVATAMARVTEDGETATIESAFETRDGESIPYEFTGAPLVDHEGTELGLVGIGRDISARRERDFRRSAALDGCFSLISLLDLDGTVVDANETACNFAGESRAAILGEPLWATGPLGADPEVRETLRTAVDRAATGEFVREEVPVSVGAGEVVLDLSLKPACDGDDVSLLVLEARDITEMKRNERELDESRRLLRQVVDSIPQRVLLKDADGVVLFSNRAADELLDDDGPFPARDTDFLPPAGTESLREADWKVVDTGEPIETEDVVRIDGEKRLFRSVKRPFELSGDGGRVVLSVSEDVTERRTFERRLRALQAVARDMNLAESAAEVAQAAVEAADDVLGLPVTGCWRYDPAAGSLIPLAETETALDLFGGAPTFGPGDSLAWEVFDTGEHAVYEDIHDNPGRHNPDSPVRAEILVPMGDVGVITTGATEPREFDDATVDLFRVLAATTEAAIRRAEREAETRRQNERLDAFAGVVSHDLRNPLNVVLGTVDLLRTRDDPDDIDRIERAAERMTALVEDLLTLAREGRDIDETEPVSLAAVAAESWESAVPAESGAVLDTDAVAGLTVDADRSRCCQLFENLLGNAHEHGGPDVRVTVGPLADGTGFYVADDGPGVPAAERDAVFDPGRTSNAGGTGLGLSIVRDIADAHGWQVDLTEGADGGARFELRGAPLRSDRDDEAGDGASGE